MKTRIGKVDIICINGKLVFVLPIGMDGKKFMAFKKRYSVEILKLRG